MHIKYGPFRLFVKSCNASKCRTTILADLFRFLKSIVDYNFVIKTRPSKIVFKQILCKEISAVISVLIGFCVGRVLCIAISGVLCHADLRWSDRVTLVISPTMTDRHTLVSTLCGERYINPYRPHTIACMRRTQLLVSAMNNTSCA